MRQSFSWGSQNQKIDSRRTEFIRMRGPSGKGNLSLTTDYTNREVKTEQKPSSNSLLN